MAVRLLVPQVARSQIGVVEPVSIGFSQCAPFFAEMYSMALPHEGVCANILLTFCIVQLATPVASADVPCAVF